MNNLFITAASAVLALSCADPAAAKADFSGKTITIVIGFGAGGSYDAYSRLIADHIGAYLPGHPTVIVNNMPGGGGRRSEVYLATAAPKDGTVVSIVPDSIVLDSLEGDLPGKLTPARSHISAECLPPTMES
jgi:tripartite-type tricarboxylate transporter receptor subunit TctC